MNVVLTVKRVDGAVVTPYETTVDTANMLGLQAVGSDSRFFSPHWGTKPGPVEIVVEETYAQVKALMSLSTTTSGAIRKGVWGMIDTAIAGSLSVADHNVVDPVTLQPVIIPKGAIVRDGFILNKTTFTSAAQTATIALNVDVDAAAGLKAAVLVSNAQWIGANTKTAIIPVNTVATQLAPTIADRNLTYTVAVQALTAGKALVYLEYTIDPLA